ncbi:hypothetical protein GLE_3401 [Lysobacter enzymogenes]|uniref:DUF1800 domain-containing protein n=1 Tax=Lysobacter enzymogenes TaxID=69 RepID=A0A0S2DJD3_LYSEN|nr:DUF1800 domain-containing protein [Lysobacter enzymogenes]ALN58747.1 hypothetical protein GLE_3401 [Lysobacter enzymogenes]
MSASKATAANRFGLGARPGELERGGGDGREILLAQLRRPPALDAFAGLPGSVETMRLEFRQQQLNRAARARRAAAAGDGEPAMAVTADPAAPATAADETPPRARRRARDADPAQAARERSSAARAGAGADGAADSGETLRRELRRQQLAEFAARYRHAADTDAPFVERLSQFWSNHFAVSIDKGNARLYAGSMEREAIRPHVLGRFEDMLLAVERHPAMLRYLDNAASIGDDSRAAMRAQKLGREKRGLNENLAREILELHTLGVDGGYRQEDVVELARAITGWSTPGPRDEDAAQSFVFRANAHEPGARRVLGRSYAEGGQEQGRAVLADLARHPATARHLSFKLARHFVADQPPPALVERMAQAYLREDGDLRALYRALVESEQAWSADARKFKTPNDFVISALRAGELPVDDQARALVGLLASLGQPVFTPRSPAGFPDTAADWSSPDGLFKRIQAAQMFAARVDSADISPYQRALAVLGSQAVSGDFAIGLRRAGSASDGCSLLFASPAFQWRV